LCPATIIHTFHASPIVILGSDTASAGIGWFSTTLKGLTMDARFLRDEAARFRGMAEDADREATRERFLVMAADYDARAKAAHESEEPSSGVADKTMTDPNPGEANGEIVEPTTEDAPKITLGRKIATGLKETVLVERRPVGRPRRE
jgi:hypothetical protein